MPFKHLVHRAQNFKTGLTCFCGLAKFELFHDLIAFLLSFVASFANPNFSNLQPQYLTTTPKLYILMGGGMEVLNSWG